MGGNETDLLYNWDFIQDNIQPGKLADKRPILVTGGSGDDVVKEILDETNAGMYGSTVEDIKNILRELYSEYKLTGKITYNGDMDKINKYSYREMARKFAKILDGLT